MWTPVERESASYSGRSRPWNMPVLSTIVPPPSSRNSASLRGQSREDLGPVDRDVVAVLRAGHDGQQRLVDGDDPELIGGDRAEDRVHGRLACHRTSLRCRSVGRSAQRIVGARRGDASE